MLHWLGAIVLVIGLLMVAGRAGFAASALHANGRITDMKVTSVDTADGDSHTNIATIRFQDADGRAHSVTMQVEDGRYVGDAVDVMYPEGRPQDADLGGFRGQWVLPLLIVIAGSFLLLLGWLGPVKQTQS